MRKINSLIGNAALHRMGLLHDVAKLSHRIDGSKGYK